MQPTEMEDDEILSAFVDGEPVDSTALAAALAAPGARDTLIDFIRLRAATTLDETPSPAFVRAMRTRLGGGTQRRAVSGLVKLTAAAALAALATVGAYDLARSGRQRSDEPPTPTRTIRFEPGVDWKPLEGR